MQNKKISNEKKYTFHYYDDTLFKKKKITKKNKEEEKKVFYLKNLNIYYAKKINTLVGNLYDYDLVLNNIWSFVNQLIINNIIPEYKLLVLYEILHSFNEIEITNVSYLIDKKYMSFQNFINEIFSLLEKKLYLKK